MKTALVTLALGEQSKKLFELTKPSIIRYASKISSEFICIDKPIYKEVFNNNIYFERYQIYNLLKDYNRILYIDSDIIISDDCPNIFEIVSESHIGGFIISKYSDFHNFSNQTIKKYFGDFDYWTTEERDKDIYQSFNAGVMVFSSHHMESFHKNFEIAKKYCNLKIKNTNGNWLDIGDQAFINYVAQKERLKIQDIGYKFNHTCAVNFKTNRFNSYIIHYAGESHKLKNTNKIDKIKKDLTIINTPKLFELFKNNDDLVDFYDSLM